MTVDAHYRRLGREHVRELSRAGGRTWARGLGSRTSESTERRGSGQDWDEYSALAWTLSRLTRTADIPG